MALDGQPDYQSVRQVAEGIAEILKNGDDASCPLYLTLDVDVAKSLGAILKEEIKITFQTLNPATAIRGWFSTSPAVKALAELLGEKLHELIFGHLRIGRRKQKPEACTVSLKEIEPLLHLNGLREMPEEPAINIINIIF